LEACDIILSPNLKVAHRKVFSTLKAGPVAKLSLDFRREQFMPILDGKKFI
jgi:hypothetical protein